MSTLAALPDPPTFDEKERAIVDLSNRLEEALTELAALRIEHDKIDAERIRYWVALDRIRGSVTNGLRKPKRKK